MSEAFRIGPFVLDAATGVLTRDGAPVALGKRAVAVLAVLVRSPQAFVAKERILEAAWPGLVVQESNLAVQVLSIRRALAQAEGGEAWLENLPRRGYRFVGPVLPLASAPAATAPGGPPTNLPEPLTSFVGRERERAEVAALLREHRLLTLTGAGGVGKTRLAIRAASAALGGYPDGAWLVELASMTDPALVPRAVGAALGLEEQPGRAPLDALADALRDKRMLVVLDNAEHLLAACGAMVDALMRRCPRVAWLATSRERLAVPGEQVYGVPSLALPDADREPSPASLAGCDSVRLLCERARLHAPRFALRDDNARALAAICRKLDGMPLAIELAAARLRTIDAGELERRLEHRFAVLVGGPPTLPARQQTLRAAIDWSHGLLDPGEQALFARLAAFAGGFALEAAERVCAGDGIDAARVLDLVASLADKHLVEVEERAGEARYRLLESIRAYAADRLAERGEAARCADAHLAWALDFAGHAEPLLVGAEQQAWLDRFDAEHDNLRAALAHALAGDDALPRLRLVTLCSRFRLVRGHAAEARAALARVLARPGGEGTVDRAKALNWAGVFAWKQGDYAAARGHYEDSLAIRRGLGDRAGVGAVLSNLGLLAYEQGDYAAARAQHEASLAIDRELGDRWGVAVSLVHLGSLAAAQGDVAAARARYAESLAGFRALGDRGHAASVLHSLGMLALREGDTAEARRHLAASLEDCRALGDRAGIAWALDGLGAAARRDGDATAASALLEEALATFRAQGHRKGAADALLQLGEIAADRGDRAAARANLGESLALFDALGDRSGIAAGVERLAALAAASGDPARAARLWGAMAALRESIAAPLEPDGRARHARDVVDARAALGDEDAFGRAWREGRAMATGDAVALALATPTA